MVTLLISESVEVLTRVFFSVVRNPYSRLVSCWSDRLRTEGGFRATFKSRGFDREFGFSNKMTFFEFASLVCNIPDEMSDCHFASMVFVVDYFTGKRLDDFVRLEMAMFDWNKLGIDYKLGFSKKSNHKQWKDYYMKNPDLIELVYRRYERDFVDFG